MLPDPTERDVNPLLFRTGIRTVKKLVLTFTIHDQKVTMIKPARANITIRTGLALPFEKRPLPKTHRHNELRLSTLPKKWLIIAVPSCVRCPCLVRGQVRRSRRVSLGTPCMASPGVRLPSSVQRAVCQHRSPACGPTAGPCPYEYEQEHEKKQGDRPRCVVRSLPYPISHYRKGRNMILPFQGTPEPPYSRPGGFPQLGRTQRVPNLPARPRWRGSKEKRWKVGYSDSTPRPGFLLRNPQAGAWNATCHTSSCTLPGACCMEARSLQQDTNPC